MTVEAFEEVTVPAGTFKAFRVRASNNMGEQSVNWLSPELGLFVKGRTERTAEHPAGAGVREMELKTVDVRR
jgi:hypothetical protein